MSELSPVVVGVASHDRDGRQSSVTLATYHPPSQPQAQPEQYRLVSEKNNLCLIPFSDWRMLSLSLSLLLISSSFSLSLSSPFSYSSSSFLFFSFSFSFCLFSLFSPQIQCIVLYDYDPEKMSPSDNPQLELKISEGNLLRCYPQDSEESEIYTMAEVGPFTLCM